MYKGFIFDLDGVLIDSSRIHYDGWKRVLEGLGNNLDYDTFRTKLFGKRGPESLEFLFGKGKFSDSEAKAISDRVDSNFVENVAALGVPVNGALDFVKALRNSGTKIALATSAPRQNVDAFLDAFSLSGIFDAVVCGDDVVHGKPDPEVFLKAASMLGEKPGDCVIFEDSPPGVTAAKAAGATCVALLTTTVVQDLSPADFYVEDFNDENLENIFGFQPAHSKPKQRERA